jgi:hypothetical protein
MGDEVITDHLGGIAVGLIAGLAVGAEPVASGNGLPDRHKILGKVINRNVFQSAPQGFIAADSAVFPDPVGELLPVFVACVEPLPSRPEAILGLKVLLRAAQAIKAAPDIVVLWFAHAVPLYAHISGDLYRYFNMMCHFKLVLV